jgi:hypothetical protein
MVKSLKPDKIFNFQGILNLKRSQKSDWSNIVSLFKKKILLKDEESPIKNINN